MRVYICVYMRISVADKTIPRRVDVSIYCIHATFLSFFLSLSLSLSLSVFPINVQFK